MTEDCGLKGERQLTQDGQSTVNPEGATVPEYLPAILSNQPDSGNRELGPKTCLGRNQLDYTCGIVTTSFDAPVDVTGAVSNCDGTSPVGLTEADLPIASTAPM